MGLSISCLMVTQPGRDHLAIEAVGDFAWQTWPTRDLVIVTDEAHDTYWLEAEIAKRHRGIAYSIHKVPTIGGSRPSLGAMRNVAMNVASGALLAQWDDDDRYHPHRLAIQANVFYGVESLAAACLADQLYYFIEEKQLYWIEWKNRGPRRTHAIPGTIVVNRSHTVAARVRYPETGSDCHRGEDSVYLDEIAAAGITHTLYGCGECYFRRYHGNNTWDSTRFRSNASWLGRTVEQITGNRHRLEAVLPYYGIKEPISVMGRDGFAFTYNPRITQ